MGFDSINSLTMSKTIQLIQVPGPPANNRSYRLLVTKTMCVLWTSDCLFDKGKVEIKQIHKDLAKMYALGRAQRSSPVLATPPISDFGISRNTRLQKELYEETCSSTCNEIRSSSIYKLLPSTTLTYPRFTYSAILQATGLPAYHVEAHCLAPCINPKICRHRPPLTKAAGQHEQGSASGGSRRSDTLPLPRLRSC